jgi:hypothetical protein
MTFSARKWQLSAAYKYFQHQIWIFLKEVNGLIPTKKKKILDTYRRNLIRISIPPILDWQLYRKKYKMKWIYLVGHSPIHLHNSSRRMADWCVMWWSAPYILCNAELGHVIKLLSKLSVTPITKIIIIKFKFSLKKTHRVT